MTLTEYREYMKSECDIADCETCLKEMAEQNITVTLETPEGHDLFNE